MLDVLSDELRHPAFPADELDKARAQALAGIEEARSETGALAEIAFDDALYPKGHPYYSPDAGRTGRVPQGPHPAGLGRLPRRPLCARQDDPHHRRRCERPGRHRAGDQILRRLAEEGQPARRDHPRRRPAAGPEKTVVIPVPDKAQVDVRYGYPGQLTRKDPDFYRVVVLNTILGGGTGLASRLATNVRDKHGPGLRHLRRHRRLARRRPVHRGLRREPGQRGRRHRRDEPPARPAARPGRRRPRRSSRPSPTSPAPTPSPSPPTAPSPANCWSPRSTAWAWTTSRSATATTRPSRPDEVNAAAKKYLRPGTGALVIAGTYTGKYATQK